MRCQEGDLAIRVKDSVGGSGLIPIGSIVTCLKFQRECICEYTGGKYKNVWVVERLDGSTRHKEGGIYGVLDQDLYPIRDKEGTDESLEWGLNKPKRAVVWRLNNETNKWAQLNEDEVDIFKSKQKKR